MVHLLQACNLRLSVLWFCTSMTSGLNLLLGSCFCSWSIFSHLEIHSLVESAGDDGRICSYVIPKLAICCPQASILLIESWTCGERISESSS